MSAQRGFVAPPWLVHLEAIADALENEWPLPDRPGWLAPRDELHEYVVGLAAKHLSPIGDRPRPSLTLIQGGRDAG